MTTKKQLDLDHMEKVLILMKNHGVQKFSLNDLTVEFDIYVSAKETLNPTATLDDEKEKRATLRAMLEEAADDEATNLLYSV